MKSNMSAHTNGNPRQEQDPGELRDAVAIDGPAGSGKSSVARRIAEERGFLYVDTGAMYRAVALKAMRRGADLENPDAMAAVAESADIRFDATGARVLLDGEDVSRAIRSPEVSRNVKFAARVPAIRERLVAMQQALCEERPVVMEGRDITTVVLPRARWKFFLTASPEARAERRHAEMRAAGREVDLGDILADINARDAGDGIRYLDTSAMSPDEVVAAILGSIAQ